MIAVSARNPLYQSYYFCMFWDFANAPSEQLLFLNTKWRKSIKEGNKKEVTEQERELDDFLDYVENPESYVPQKPLAQQIDVEVKRNKKNQKVRDEYMTVADLIAEHVGKALEEEKKEMEAKVEEEKQRADEEKQRADQAQQQADVEKQRANEEKQRADQAQQKADIEKERADQAELEIQKLREQLKELRRQK